jgi:hypothetical protein
LFAEHAPGFEQWNDEGLQISISHDQLAYTFFKAALADKAHFESEGSKCRPNMIVEVALLVEQAPATAHQRS